MPDRGYHRRRPPGTWLATAAILVEIVSPDDETYDKFGFYARHEVDELLVADPASHAVSIWRLTAGDGYERVLASSLLEVSAADLVVAIAWPDSAD